MARPFSKKIKKPNYTHPDDWSWLFELKNEIHTNNSTENKCDIEVCWETQFKPVFLEFINEELEDYAEFIAEKYPICVQKFTAQDKISLCLEIGAWLCHMPIQRFIIELGYDLGSMPADFIDLLAMAVEDQAKVYNGMPARQTISDWLTEHNTLPHPLSVDTEQFQYQPEEIISLARNYFYYNSWKYKRNTIPLSLNGLKKYMKKNKIKKFTLEDRWTFKIVAFARWSSQFYK